MTQLVASLNWADNAEKFGAIATQPVALSVDPDWFFNIDGQFGQSTIRARYVQIDNLANPQQVQVIFHGNMPNTINQFSKVTIPIPDGANNVEIKLLGTPTVIFDVVARFSVTNINQTDSVNIYAITQAVKTGGLLKPINVRNGNYAVAASDLSSINDFVIVAPASATLPDATAIAAGTGNGFWTEIWNDKTSTANLTILPNGTQTIDGAASLVIAPGFKVLLVSDGSNFVSDLINVPIAAQVITAGMEISYHGNAAPSGWVMADGLTIGNAGSGATERANADTSALFTILWNSYANAQLPVSGGRGASAAIDFAALKTITLPDKRGRATFGLDNMGGSTAGRITATTMSPNGITMGATGGAETVALIIANLAAHTHNINGAQTTGSNTQVTIAASATGTSVASGSQGSGTAFNKMPPAWVNLIIIKL